MTWRPNQFADAPFPAGMLEDIARVIREDSEPPGLSSYDRVFESGLMFPLQRRQEMEAMIRLARRTLPRVVMEIGADKGGGPYHWLKCLHPERFIGIEIRGTPYGELLSAAFPQTRCLWLGESSYAPATVETVRSWLEGEAIDVLFIDGDKSRFMDDFTAYLPMVRVGGVVFMHDVKDAAPGAAFSTAKNHPRVRGSFAFESTCEVAEAMARELEGADPRTAHEGWLRWWKGRSCGVGVLWV